MSMQSSPHIHGPHPYGEWYPQPQGEVGYTPAMTIAVTDDGTILEASSIVTPYGYQAAGGAVPKNAHLVSPAMTIGTV